MESTTPIEARVDKFLESVEQDLLQRETTLSTSASAERPVRLTVGDGKPGVTRGWNLYLTHPIFAKSEILAAYVSRWLPSDRRLLLPDEDPELFDEVLFFVETNSHALRPLLEWGLRPDGSIRSDIQLYVLARKLLMAELTTFLSDRLRISFCPPHPSASLSPCTLNNNELIYLYCNTTLGDPLRKGVLERLVAHLGVGNPEVINFFKPALTEVPELAADLLITLYESYMDLPEVLSLASDNSIHEQTIVEMKRLLAFVRDHKSSHLQHIEQAVSTMEEAVKIRIMVSSP